MKFEAELPDARISAANTFQTKSLYRLLEHLTITAAGRLIHHKAHETTIPSTDINGKPLNGREEMPVGDIDLEFHGNIRFDLDAAGEYVNFVARFTHGQLEWIKPYAHLSDVQRTWCGIGD